MKTPKSRKADGGLEKEMISLLSTIHGFIVHPTTLIITSCTWLQWLILLLTTLVLGILTQSKPFTLFPLCYEIFRIPISKTGTIPDKLLWKHSNSGDFKVKKAYALLLKDSYHHPPNQHRLNHIPQEAWNSIWKVKVPLKICNFVWKLMHNSLPTFLTLKNKGIPTTSTYPLYKIEEESTSHLFLYCPFARATWHGSPLAVHTSNLNDISIQQWVRTILIRHKNMESDSMGYLQAIFTTLWTIWNHRSLVVYEGKQPNPMEVFLTTQTISCRYKYIYIYI